MHTLAATLPEPSSDETRLSTQDYRHLIALPEKLRTLFFESADQRQQKSLGQFFTPPHIADLMASMFRQHQGRICLLDPGAGMGMLSAAFVRRQLLQQSRPEQIDITAYEVDSALIPYLEQTYEACRLACHSANVGFSVTIHNTDFIAEGTRMLRDDFFSTAPQAFDAVIVNPPYGKLLTTSPDYRMLRSVHAETTNLYAAFLNLIIGLLRTQGELVAITPRSFCNGPYFRPFRQRILAEMAFHRIHVFESRKAAFKHDTILQENVILCAIKQTAPGPTITVSQSTGDENGTVHARIFPTEEIVSPTDAEVFIHIPTSEKHIAARDQVSRLGSTLSTLGLTVSTGRVVDYRARDYIRPQPESGTSPLIYPCHFDGLFLTWPKEGGRKPNAIMDTDETRSLLVPTGVYVLTKRFTSKEERRRLVACICDPTRLASRNVGFENHLNYIHADGKGLDMPLAKGLWTYLNSSTLDLCFRQFNGHTQVNATDLRNVRFPSAEQLRRMGQYIQDTSPEQDAIDAIVDEELSV